MPYAKALKETFVAELPHIPYDVFRAHILPKVMMKKVDRPKMRLISRGVRNNADAIKKVPKRYNEMFQTFIKCAKLLEKTIKLSTTHKTWFLAFHGNGIRIEIMYHDDEYQLRIYSETTKRPETEYNMAGDMEKEFSGKTMTELINTAKKPFDQQIQLTLKSDRNVKVTAKNTPEVIKYMMGSDGKIELIQIDNHDLKKTNLITGQNNGVLKMLWDGVKDEIERAAQRHVRTVELASAYKGLNSHPYLKHNWLGHRN